MKVRQDKLDVIFSKLIRLRDNNTCQRCGRTAATVKIECSHFWSRRHQATRHHPDNACAHCFTCHQYLGENPVEFQSWIRGYLGDERYAALNNLHHTIVKRTKVEKAALYSHLRQQYAALCNDEHHVVAAFD